MATCELRCIGGPLNGHMVTANSPTFVVISRRYKDLYGSPAEAVYELDQEPAPHAPEFVLAFLHDTVDRVKHGPMKWDGDLPREWAHEW